MPDTQTAERRAAQVVQTIEQSNRDLSIINRCKKYARMAISPFVFYRGTNLLFWGDFAKDPRLKRFGNKRTRTWIEGDAHVENVGAFANNRGKIV